MSAVAAHDLAANRLRSLVRQLGLSRAGAAKLLRAIADELDNAGADEHVLRLAHDDAARLRELGFTVGPAPRFDVPTVAAAHVLDRSSGTLRNWRSYGVGPAWRIDGNRVMYQLTDLIAWRASRSVTIFDPAAVV